MNFIGRKNEKIADIENYSRETYKNKASINELGYSIYRAIEFRNNNLDRRNLMLQYEYVRNRF